MTWPDSLQSALKSLSGALDLLDAAVERRAQADAARADLEQELAIMAEDRADLGEDLESCEQANERLRATAGEVAERLARMDAACAALRDRLAG